METKTYRAQLELKADSEQGEFEAVFATLNVIDHDGDVTLPGAFGEQRVLIEPWNHDYSRPPVGKGVIGEKDDEAYVEGRFFLDTEAGREHYTVVKALEDMQEWSYTFRVVDADPGVFEGESVRFLKRMDVIGVSPVTRGAGIGTRTTTIKNARDGAAEPEDEHTEGEADGDAGKPSGVSPRVVLTEIEIELLEG